LWPVNRRFSIRHEVNLPVEYEHASVASSPVRFGITADLNETGMALIAYEKLEPGTIIRMTIRGANEVVKCKAEVRGGTPLSREAGFPGYRYGIQFLNLTSPQIDALNRLCLHFAVPRMYEQYNKGNRNGLFRRLTNWRERGMIQRRREARYGYHLPLILNTGTTEETLQYTATEDLSRVATAAIIDQELPPGTPVSFLMPSPLGDVRGTGRAIRSERRQYAGQVYHRATIEFDEFEGQGRNIVQSLANPDQTQVIDPVLRPRKDLPRVQMAGPIMIGLIILIPLLIGLRFVVFKFVHDDDLFLRDKINSKDISDQDATRIESIYARTMEEKYPSTDRLVLLMQIMASNKTELDKVTTLLGQRDPNNWELRKAMAQSMNNMQKYGEAEREYQILLDHAERTGYDDARKKELYVAAARSSVNAGKFDQAADYFRRALTITPDDRQLRNWYAGALVSTGKRPNLNTAKNVLNETPPDMEGRQLLVDIYLQQEDLVMAEREAKKLLEENPDSPLARQRVADIYQANKQFTMSRNLYQALADKSPEDSELQYKVAQAALASGDLKEAFARYKRLIERTTTDKTPLRLEVVKGYIDTASVSKTPPEDQEETLLKVYRQVADNPIDDGKYYSRLGWALEQAGKLNEAETILEAGAKRFKPSDLPSAYPEQYAALLIKREKFAQAGDLVEKIDTLEAQRLLVIAKMNNRDFQGATAAAEALIKKEPGNIKNQELLVDVLCLAGDFERAINEMSRYPVMKPEDRILIDIKKAKILLWAGSKDSNNFNLASVQLQKLIEPDIEGRRELWDFFIDATASATNVEPGTLDLTKKLAERLKNSTNTKVGILSRLAWILVRGKQYPLAQPLLDQAMKTAPKESEAIRKELAGVMASAERYKDAVILMTGIKLDVEGHYTMAQLHAGEKDFTTAEFHVREMLKLKPNEQKTKEGKAMLADITSWKQEYPQAIVMFEKLREEYPDEPRYPIRIAEIILWSKEYEKSMEQFAMLFDRYPQETQIWEGFAKSAAQAKRIPTTLTKTAQAIADKVASFPDSSNPVLFAATAWMLSKMGNVNLSDSLLARVEDTKIEDPAARREMARIYYELRRFREGLKLFENVPMNEEDRYRKIDFAVQLKYAKVVREEAEILLKLKPMDFRARGALAYALSLEDKHKEALALYEKLLQENPGNEVVDRAIADALLASEYYQEAIRRYETIFQKKSEDKDLWLRFIDSAAMAVTLENDNQKRLMFQVYERILKSDIEDAPRFSRLAWAFLKHFDDAGKATVLINRAIELNSKVADVRVEIAGVLARLERLPEALYQFEGLDLSRLNIKHRQLYIDLLIAIKPQRLAKAEMELKLLLQEKHEEKTLAGLQSLLAQVLAWEQKFEESLRIFDDLVRRYPENPDLRLKQSFVILWSKRYDEALVRFGDFMDKYPENPEAWVGYVEAVTGASREKITEKVQTRVLDIYAKAMKFDIRSDEDVRNLSSLGASLAKLNKKPEARAAFKRALEFAPDSKAAWRRYGETLYAMGDFDEANRIFSGILNGTIPPASTRTPR
jgi:tetratricopeptide (TPR) repeat protein